MPNMSEYIAVSKLLPAWAAVASAEDEHRYNEDSLWDFIAFSIKLHEIRFIAPIKMVNEVRLKPDLRTPFEYIVPLRRVAELARFVGTLDPATMFNEVKLPDLRTPIKYTASHHRAEELSRFMETLDRSTLGELMLAKSDLRIFAHRWNLKVPSILEEIEVGALEDPTGKAQPSVDREPSPPDAVPSDINQSARSSTSKIPYSHEFLRKNPRGPNRAKYEQALEAMRRDIQSGRSTELSGMTEESLAREYNVSRTTFRRAREALALEILTSDRNK
jgi:hypothetical protein